MQTFKNTDVTSSAERNSFSNFQYQHNCETQQYNNLYWGISDNETWLKPVIKSDMYIHKRTYDDAITMKYVQVTAFRNDVIDYTQQ